MMVIKKTQNITSYSNIKKKINDKIVFRTTILASLDDHPIFDKNSGNLRGSINCGNFIVW